MPFTKNLRMIQLVRWSSIATGCLGSCLLLWGVSSCSSELPDANSATQSSGYGTLNIVANGEDFIRRGFLTKDGWQLSFDHVYVTLSNITVQPPQLPPDLHDQVDSSTDVVSLGLIAREPVTVDLAEGDEQAEAIAVTSFRSPAGHYRNLSWHLVPALQGPAKGSSLFLEGTARKQSETVQFALNLDPTLSFACGDFIGDTRKGILKKNQKAELEATFHFDHLFGDGEAAASETINTKALGFGPIAQLADNGTVDLDMSTLTSKLSATETDMLNQLLLSLGHVGEGHCEAKRI